MNREEYRQAMEQVKPQDGKKEKLWEQISQEINETDTKRRKRAPIWKGSAAAAVILLICALVIPGSAFADEVKALFMGFLKNEETVQQYVKESVYEDSDGHVKMQVTELLSDEVVVLATVKYDALDEKGKEWLSVKDISQSDPFKGPNATNPAYLNLNILPDYKGNTWKYGVNGGYGGTELTEYRTDTSRVYLLTCEASNWSSSMAKCEFTYVLTDGEEHAVSLDTSVNIPVYEYDLKAKNNETLSRYYKPTHIRLSRLSYVIYGKQNGLFENISREEVDLYISRSLLTEEEESAERIVSVVSQTKEGESISLAVSGMLGVISTETEQLGNGYDCYVVSGNMQNIYDRTIWKDTKEKTVDPETISGIRITRNGDVVQKMGTDEIRKHNTVEYEFIKK